MVLAAELGALITQGLTVIYKVLMNMIETLRLIG